MRTYLRMLIRGVPADLDLVDLLDSEQRPHDLGYCRRPQSEAQTTRMVNGGILNRDTTQSYLQTCDPHRNNFYSLSNAYSANETKRTILKQCNLSQEQKGATCATMQQS